ncbi:MAG: helix-turn-helix domain-containing protein [Firmicutes bacterium]|nr:helix-turn-helix domain-containing protein [Bacillota bacterium]
MLLEEVAGELVELTSSLVGGRTINIMNTDGIIIASSDRSRVGSYHHGAKEAVQKGSAVNIYRNQLDYYHGAKEGCNMPFRVNGAIVGVVGIYGNPDEIQELAHLLEEYVSKYYQLQSLLRPIGSEEAIRGMILANLFSPSEENLSTASSLMDQLGVRLVFPVLPVVIDSPEPLTLERQEKDLLHELETKGLADRKRDLWGILNKRMVLLMSFSEDRSVEALKKLTEKGYRVSLGRQAATLWEIRAGYQQAALLDLCGEEAWQDMADLPTRCRYLLYQSAGESTDLLDFLAQRFTKAFSPEEQQMLLLSAKVYYEEERSITRASERLFVHKNTLQYRIKRLMRALQIEEFPAFWQEYILRLLIQRFSMNSKR